MEPIDDDQLYRAYDAYYESYKTVVYKRVCWRLARYGSRAKPHADDVFQEIFVSLFRWMKGFWERTHEAPSKPIFESALKKIEMTKYLNYRARHLAPLGAQLPLREASDPEESAPETGALCAELAAGQPDPYEDFRFLECQDRLENCLQKLRANESSAIVCKVIGYSDKEIAALIDEEVSTVTHSIIPLARKKLRACMEDYLHGVR